MQQAAKISRIKKEAAMAVVIMEKTIENKRAELILDMPHVIVRYDGCVISALRGII